jgi:hypothetical protein
MSTKEMIRITDSGHEFECICQDFELKERSGHSASCSREFRKFEERQNKPVKAPKPIAKLKVKDLKDSNAWTPFSKFIRLRDSDENGNCKCFTCGYVGQWNSGLMQAGHFIGRRHWATRYHEKNVHAQCVECNNHNGGMQYEYALKLDEVYGQGTAEELRQLSKTEMHVNQDYIDELAAQYREKVKELISERHRKSLIEPHRI